MASFSYYKEAEIIQAFNSTSRYLDDLMNTVELQWLEHLRDHEN